MVIQRVQGQGLPVVAPITPPVTTGETPATAATPVTPSPDAASTAQDVPVDNQTQTYQTGPSANDVNFPTPATEMSLLDEAQLRNVDSLFAPSSSIPTALREKQDQLAKSLGFRNRDALSHHLRRFEKTEIQLPSGQRVNLKERLLSLVQQGAQQGGSPSVREAFNQTFREGISSIFQRSPLKESNIPEPQFRTQARVGSTWQASPTTKWDAASLASVYNGLETIYEQSPERLLSVAQGAGMAEHTGVQKPLEFIRRDQPPISNRDDYLTVLSEATRIAHAEHESGQVYLYDAAVVGDQSLITDLVVDKIDLISRFQEGELTPTYTSGEMADRGLNQHNGERQTDYRARLRDKLSTDYVNRLGGMQNLQRAMNFVARYRNLPVPQVPENGQANDPRTLAVLQNFGTKLPEVMARMEQIDAVTKMQQFLKDNAPPGSPMENLPVDGYIGNRTESMTRAFQTSLALNTFKERIEDDPQLSENRKRDLVTFINQKFQTLNTSPEQSQQILGEVRQRMNNLIAETPSQLSESTRAGLQQDVSETTRLVQGGHFNRETAEYLVNGWLNVMDSGKGHDLAEQLVVHELGHIWQHDLETQGLEIEKNWTSLFDNSLQRSGYSTAQMNQADYQDRLRDDQASSSDYGSASAEEDFAEATRVFTYDPPRLMRRSLMKFLVVNALSPPENRKSNQEIREMATAAGYTSQDLQNRLDAVMGFGSNPIRFTLPMAARLEQAYSGLRVESATGSMSLRLPSATASPFDGGNTLVFPGLSPQSPGAGFSAQRAPYATPTLETPRLALDLPGFPTLPGGFPALTPPGDFPALTLPGGSATHQAPAPSTQESGWFFRAFSERFADLDDRLQNAGLSGPQRGELMQQKQAMIHEFMHAGPGGISGLSVPEDAASASEQVLQNRNLGPGTTSQSGRAITAALAIYHATGSFNKSQYPQLSAHLPESFDRMLANPGFQTTVGPASRFADTQMLESSFGFLQSISSRTGSANSDLGLVPMMLGSLSTHLKNNLATSGNSGFTYEQASARARELMSDPAVMAGFSSPSADLGAGLTMMNSALSGLRSITNLPISISADKFKHLLLTASLMKRMDDQHFPAFAMTYLQLEGGQG